MLREGRDLALIAIGSMVQPALSAADRLRALGVDAAVVNARFVKPLDEDTLLRMAHDTRRLVTIEEHVSQGGFGSAVAELLADRGAIEGTSLCRLSLPDAFVEHGSQTALREHYGLTPDGIVRQIAEA